MHLASITQPADVAPIDGPQRYSPTYFAARVPVNQAPMARPVQSKVTLEGALLGAVLSRLEDPVLIIDRQRKVKFVNFAATCLLEGERNIHVQSGRLGFKSTQHTRQIERYAALPARESGSCCGGLRIERGRGHRDWLLLVSELASGSMGDSKLLLLQLVSRTRPRRLPRRALRDLFQLSERELTLLAGLMRGQSLRTIAAATSLSLETVRTYLKRVFAKCEVRSQTELLSLVQRLALLESG